MLKASDLFAPRLLLTIKSCVCGVFCRSEDSFAGCIIAGAPRVPFSSWQRPETHTTQVRQCKASSYSSSISCRSNSSMCSILSVSAKGVIVVIKINLNRQFFLLAQPLCRRNEKSVWFIASYLNNNNQLLALLPLLVDVVTGWFYNCRYIWHFRKLRKKYFQYLIENVFNLNNSVLAKHKLLLFLLLIKKQMSLGYCLSTLLWTN